MRSRHRFGCLGDAGIPRFERRACPLPPLVVPQPKRSTQRLGHRHSGPGRQVRHRLHRLANRLVHIIRWGNSRMVGLRPEQASPTLRQCAHPTSTPGRAKLLLSRELGDTSTRSRGSAGASPSRLRRTPNLSLDEALEQFRISVQSTDRTCPLIFLSLFFCLHSSMAVT